MHVFASPIGDTAAIAKSLRFSVFDAAMNMAIDEAMFNRALAKGELLVRAYGFKGRAVILAERDHPDVVKGSSMDGTALTRRITAGKPIYVDETSIAYSIAGPIVNNGVRLTDSVEIHRHYGRLIGNAIRSVIGGENSVEPGEHFSIKVNGRPIAGHGQFVTKGKAYLYHGVLAMSPWDIKNIAKVLRLPEGDISEIPKLPSISDFADARLGAQEKREQFAGILLHALFPNAVGANEKELSLLMEQAAQLKAKYLGKAWIERSEWGGAAGGPLKKDSRFCLLYEG